MIDSRANANQSYNSRKIKYSDIFEQYQLLINLKNDYAGVQYDTAEDVAANVTLNETANKSYIDMTIEHDNMTVRVIFASASFESAKLTADLEGFEFLGSIGNGRVETFDYLTENAIPGTAYYFGHY